MSFNDARELPTKLSKRLGKNAAGAASALEVEGQQITF
jgi:hypothetical protein